MPERAPQATLHPTACAPARIVGAGRMAERTRAHDWELTSLGPIADWPDALVVLVNAMLANQHPSMLFWGDDLLQFFNDAAIPIVGADKQATALGQRAEECWAEVWPIVGEQIEQARAGRAVWKEDQLAPIYRNGRLENAWFTYSYSPAYDARGEICGVLVTCLETTGRMQAERQLRDERGELLKVFEQAPAFFAVLRGPDHVFERVNPKYQQVIGGLDVIGRPLREAIPGIAEQGYIAILDRVLRTGEPYIAADAHFTLPASAGRAVAERVVDFVYQPLREADGSVSGILVLGVDTTERKRVAVALAESERRAAMVLESITEGFHILDAEGRFQQFNEAGRAIYEAQGLDADALIGQRAFAIFPEHEETETGRAILTCLREKKATSLESFYPPWNRWFSLRNYPTPDGGVATFFQDITDKKRIEAQLAEQEERFAFATQVAGIGYWFCNLPFDRLVWDKTVKEHFWLEPEDEVTLERFLSLIHAEDREATRQAIERSIANHTLYDVEYRTVAPDGRVKVIRAIGRAEYGADGTPLRFDGVTQDVTELKQAREALDAERARLSAVFENVPIGILFTLADGRVVSANRQAEQILGRGVSEIPSYAELALFRADGRRVADEDRPLRRVLTEGGGIYRGEFEYRRPDGTGIWLEIIAAPILDAKGRVVGAVDALADIDVRKRAEGALVRSEKLALVGRLAASISHEINNPLEAISNLLYLIETNTGEEETRAFGRKAQEELARISHIVTHTLRFNRQSVGYGEQKMSALLESSVAIYEGRLKNSGIVLCREYEDSVSVRCAGSEIRQVFANLIANAFDATRSGGKLILRSRDQRHPATGQPGVRVTVADSGHGIPKSFRKHLFEPFFTSKGDNGTGLGLWVSREILNKHHAAVRMKSRTDAGASGTVFSMWFPA
ncbi:PAS domain S-box protein [Acidobacteria bacterium AB60]|nr:PAS domain S-box protein [Acidobacteria bacterium AB60]